MPTPNALTYNGFINAIAVLAVTQTKTNPGDSTGTLHFVEPNLDSIVPQMLNYAELRIQRDLDLLVGQTQSGDYSLALGDWTIQIPVDDFVVVQNLVLRDNSGGLVISLTPATVEFLTNAYPDNLYTGVPKYFASFGTDTAAGTGNLNYTVAPSADRNYRVYVRGLARLPSLAHFAGSPQTNSASTFISTHMPDLLLMASMIFVSAHQRNFSSAGSDPQMPVNYEQQYTTLLKAASIEEMRKRFHSIGGSAETPSLATASMK